MGERRRRFGHVIQSIRDVYGQVDTDPTREMRERGREGQARAWPHQRACVRARACAAAAAAAAAGEKRAAHTSWVVELLVLRRCLRNKAASAAETFPATRRQPPDAIDVPIKNLFREK